jgi:hypothetical protein
MWSMHRWIVGASALLALALAGCGTSQTSSSTSTSTPPRAAAAPPTPGCSGSQLTLSYSGTEGATGHLELHVAVRNSSQTACLLRGYPGARLLNRAGRPLPLHVGRRDGFFPDTESKPRAVALKPGASAHFGISLVTNNEYKGARVCRTAAAAMLSAPGSRSHWQRVSLRAAPRIAPCGSRLVVSPIHE